MEKRPYINILYIHNPVDGTPVYWILVDTREPPAHIWVIEINVQPWDIIEKQVKRFVEYGYNNMRCKTCNVELYKNNVFRCMNCGFNFQCPNCRIDDLRKHNGMVTCCDCLRTICEFHQDALGAEIDTIKKRYDI